MELLDIVDENGVPSGNQTDREEAHKKGIRHRTSHVWVARIKKNIIGKKNKEDYCLDDVELLLQIRNDNKDSHPGKLDISSAGHIPSGDTYTESAVRELREELGITVSENELHFCGKRRKEYQKNFHGSMFWDNQVSNVYVVMRDIDSDAVSYQESEISGVLWMPFADVFHMVERDFELESEGKLSYTKSCIALEEMQLLKNYLNDHLGIMVKELTNTNRKSFRLTTLCYIEKEDKYLMLYRNKKKNDQSEGKWLGVGGKLEDGESPEDCVLREVYEETGLKLTSIRPRGVVTFISDTWENELMFLYTADEFTGVLNDECTEGELKWIPKNEVLALPAWEGDKIFLKPLIEGKTDIRVKLIYEGESLVQTVDCNIA